ncbi:MAG: HPr kinase/phosphatase C-terminal domain-containing protein [Alphaproteobacteria bacterium]|nr:HPr kinase/phosphatase C-terminal domain-containing protein [Alphaproteobacteria bacterium]
MERIHATCVAIDGQGVLLRGAPGSGKSDLGLRLIDQGAALVSDDYTELDPVDGRLVSHAPDAIRGLMEVRGVGILKTPVVDAVPVAALFDLVMLSEIERLPEPRFETIAGIDVPVFRLHGFDASAPAKVRVALSALRDDRFHAS